MSMRDRSDWTGVGLCLLIAALGAVLADWAGLPLAYMLGAIGASMTAAMAGLPIARPGRLVVEPMRVALGVLLGSTLTPGLLDRLGALGASLAIGIKRVRRWL